MCRLSSACRALILYVAADSLDRGDFPEPAEGADAWSEPTWAVPTVLQTLPRRAVICAYVLSSATLGTYRARSGVGTSIGQGGDPAFAFRFRLAVGAVRAF
jgi:hypothetical protein